jgi:hypothetical protein
MSFSVRIYLIYIYKYNKFNFSSSDYYECESIEDIPENETRSCQVIFFLIKFFNKLLLIKEKKWSSFWWRKICRC